ncbi:MAG: xanthine dehydrogenase small subunit [Pseudomonadota bacterium]
MRRSIDFLLNGEPVSLTDIDPRTTLLDWLRETRRLTGTKEGCNEGDCGACTVGLTRLTPDGPKREAVNACIHLLPMLDGRAVTTVEALAGPSRLHPAQQAMVDLHGSQCGFCTPGFVMSLWADYPHGPRSAPEIPDAVAGNLCRCTGYGPILAAAAAMHDHPAPDWEPDLAPPLAALPAEPARLEAPGVAAHLPRSEAELSALLAETPGATLVAGATDVGLWITKRLDRPSTLIFLNAIEGFDAIEDAEDALTIRAGAPWSAAHVPLARLSPDLGELVRRFAGPQVRASGTVGGNLANGSPIGDGAPAFIALGATLTLRSAAGDRDIPLEDFFIAYGRQDLRPGEHVAQIRLPRPATPLKCYKISKRFDDDISAVMGAFLIETTSDVITSARIAFGGMAATPKRARAVEAALIGRPWTLATAEAALPAFAEDFQPITDMRASADYRLAVARNLLLKCAHETALRPSKTRLVGEGAAA